jgi:hypothetical protein
MNSLKRISVLAFTVVLLSVTLVFHKINAQESSQTQEKFEDQDSPETKGTYKPKFPNATENISYGSASVPHGIYVHTNRPPCQGTPGSASNNYSVCALVNVYIPLTGHVDSVSGYARETGANAYSICNSPQQDCAIGWSTYDPGYLVSTTPTNTVISWTFKNWSHNRGRDAMVAVNWH